MCMKRFKELCQPLLVAAIVTFAQMVYIVHHHAESDHCEHISYEQQHNDTCILCDVVPSISNRSENTDPVICLIQLNQHLPSFILVEDVVDGQRKNRAPPLFS